MSILYQVHVAASRTDALMSAALGDMTPQDFALYSLIRANGPLTPREISTRHGTAASSTSVALQRAEDAGHVERHRHPTDNRTFLVALTEDGLEAHGKALEQFREVLDPLLTELGPEVPAVRWGLHRLNGALGSLMGIEQADPPDSDLSGDLQTIEHRGPRLTSSELRSVREHVDYLLWRRGR